MLISCEEYYEKYLGDNCDGKCDECFGGKEVFIVKEDFEVIGETVFHKVPIKKGDWFWIKYENQTHKCLTQGTDKDLIITHELFNKNFKPGLFNKY